MCTILISLYVFLFHYVIIIYNCDYWLSMYLVSRYKYKEAYQIKDSRVSTTITRNTPHVHLITSQKPQKCDKNQGSTLVHYRKCVFNRYIFKSCELGVIYYFPIDFWNSSDGVVCFCFHFIYAYKHNIAQA